MAIMTFKEWIAATEHEGNAIETLGKGRGRLGRVDAALKVWEEVNGTGDVDVRSAALLDLVKECSKWLKLKEDEAPNKSTATRKEATMRLFGGVMEELTRINPAVLAALDRFDRKKAGGRVGGLAPLQGVYAHERTLYLENEKKRAPSATTLHQAFDAEQDKPSSSLPLVGGLFKREKFKKVADYKDLSLADFRLLDEIAGKKHDVIYLKKMQRLKYLVYPHGGLLCCVGDQPLNIPTNKVWIYAADRYGNLFVVNDKALDRGAPHPRVNHSTLNAGNDVICAGTIWVQAGVLRLINNNSGHYKPTVAHLRRMLGILDNEGVDLRPTEVELWTPAAGGIQIATYDALPFMLSLNNPKRTVVLPNVA